jgi:hypothetical protein
VHVIVRDEPGIAFDDHDVLARRGRVESDGDRGPMKKVSELLRRRHREEDDFRIASTEPHRYVVRPSIRPSRASQMMGSAESLDAVWASSARVVSSSTSTTQVKLLAFGPVHLESVVRPTCPR